MLIPIRRLLPVLSFSLALVMLSGCSSEDESPPVSTTPTTKEESPIPVLSAAGSPMDGDIAALMARAEQPDESITVQHVLIAFKGAPRMTVTRSKEEARALTEKVWTEARSGVNFKDLMQIHSNDSGGGEYPMTKARRGSMVAGFGNVGFRLKVDEIGVAPWHEKDSPFGWHIIKRIK